MANTDFVTEQRLADYHGELMKTHIAGGCVFDISAYHATGEPPVLAKYADLSAALGTNGDNVPDSIKTGGMMIRFVHTSDNKYVQYRYTSNSVVSADFTNEANWELDVTKKNLSEDFLGLLSEIKDFTIKNYLINENGKFGSNPTYKHAVIPVNEGEVYYLIGQKTTCRAAFVTTDESSSSADVPVVSGTGIMPMSSAEQYYKFIIPQGCTHLIFNASGNYGTRCYKHYDSLKEGTDEYTDDKPTAGSRKLVESGGMYKLLYNSFSYTSFDFAPDYYYSFKNKQVGDIATDNITENSDWACLRIPVEVGQIIDLKTIGGEYGRAYALTDINKTILSIAPALANYSSGITLNVEQNGYLYVNVTKAFLPNVSVVISYSKSRIDKLEDDVSELQNDVDGLPASVAHGEAAYDELFGDEEKNPEAIELESGYWYVKETPPIAVSIVGLYRNPADSVPCEPGDKFVLTGIGGKDKGTGPNSRLWAFANSNGELVRYAEPEETHTSPYEVEAQEGEVMFYMSSHKSVTPTLFKKSVTKGLSKKVSDLEITVSRIEDDITDIKESVDNSVHSVSRMFNVPLNLKKPNLKILDLGNSYTGDAIHYLTNILNAAGITTGFSLYDCIRGGSCFRDWVNMYKGTDDANYSVNKVCGDKINGITTGGNSGLDNSWFVSLLKNDWDIIIIHQESKHSGNYDGWTGEGDAGGLTEYLRILRTYCPQATIGFYIVHSYPSWKSSSYQAGADSAERWQNIAKSVEHLKADYGIDFIIPYGTAVQNLRMTSLNGTDPVDATKKNDFSADGIHLTSGIGDYVAACAYFEALFAPRYDVTVLGNTYTDTNVPVPQPGDSDYYDGRGVPVQITTANALLAQRAAVLAVNDMFNLHNPEVEGFIPVNTDTKHLYEGDGNPNYLSKESAENMLNAMVTAGVIASYTMTYDANSGRYVFVITKPA